jgi:endonuclease/exonuclease/phosphatase family metal-dependent hydrolase
VTEERDMKYPSPAPPHSIWRKLLFIIAAVPASSLAWYVVVRAISPWTAVKVIAFDIVAPPGPAGGDGEWRVATYNIANGRGGRSGEPVTGGGDRAAKTERLKQIGRLLKSESVDIVVLNEVDFSSFWSGHIDEAAIIAREAGLPWVMEQRNVDVAFPFLSIRHGNAVLSRFPISKAGRVPFPDYSTLMGMLGDKMDGSVCTVKCPDGETLRVFPVHFTLHGPALQSECVRRIRAVLKESFEPLLVMGDFNAAPPGFGGGRTAAPGGNTIQLMLDSKAFTTAPFGSPEERGHCTFPAAKPDRIIDWIFVTAPWQVAEKKILPTELSDHLPVFARLVRVHTPSR